MGITVTTTTTITVSYRGGLDDEKDHLIDSIVEAHGGENIGSGMLLVGGGVRDIQFEIGLDRVEECLAALKAAGFDGDAPRKRKRGRA